MSAEARPLLALALSTEAAPGAWREALRLLVAARAAARPVRLLDLRAEGAAPLPQVLDDEEARLLEALLHDGVVLERPAPGQQAAVARAALEQAGSVLALAPATRPQRPAVLVLTSALLATTPDEALLPALGRAGTWLRL